MALISITEVDNRLNTAYFSDLKTKSARDILKDETKKYPMNFNFDIFLSHCYSDAQVSLERLLGLKTLLEDLKYSVYVDWIIDSGLNRENVNESTAAILRTRMSFSRCLLFTTSQNSQNSKWMPWELGYKDGQSSKEGDLGRVAILPLAQSSGQSGYKGQEYLGMYPYIDKAKDNAGNIKLWVHTDETTYVSFDAWLLGKNPTKRS